jgi:hypothetical protein
VHPTAEAKLLNAVKDGGGVDSWAAESIIPARKGAVLGECLEIAAATDSDPADWPYNFMKFSEKSSAAEVPTMIVTCSGSPPTENEDCLFL